MSLVKKKNNIYLVKRFKTQKEGIYLAMNDLLTHYSITEIIIFVVALAAAIKTVVTFWDWAVDRLKKVFNKENSTTEAHNKFNQLLEDNVQKIEQLTQQQQQILDHISSMDKTIKLLTISDKDDIKAWITEKHHYFCYEIKHIDDYSLDCIEKRYNHYVDEGGNSFIGGLMEEIRKLPKVSDINKK